MQCCLICGSLISLRTPATTTSSSSPPLTPPLPPPPAAVAVVILYLVAGTIMHSSLLLLLSSSTAVLYLRYPSFLTFLLGRYPFETASAAAKESTSMISSSSSLSLSSLSAMTMTSSDKPVVFRPSVPLLYRLFFLFFLPDGGSNSFLTSPNRMSCSLSSSSLVPPVRSNTLSGDGFFSLFLLPSSILGIVVYSSTTYTPENCGYS